MKYVRTLAVALGLISAPLTPSEAKEPTTVRKCSVDTSRLEYLSGEIVNVENRRVGCYRQVGDNESATRITDIPCWYALISVQSIFDGKITTVAVNPRRNEGTGLEAMTPPLAKGAWVNGMKYYPSLNRRVHERDIASLVLYALGTRATAHEIEADGIVHPLY